MMGILLFRVTLIGMIFLISNPLVAKTQKLTRLSFPVFMETRLHQDDKTHLINLKITVVNSSKALAFSGEYGACSITYVIQQRQKQIASYPGKSTRSGVTVTCPTVAYKSNLAPSARQVILEMQLQNRYFELLRLKPGKYLFKGSFSMGGQIGTQKMSKFPLGPMTFTVK
jgi:hypothetical protein